MYETRGQGCALTDPGIRMPWGRLNVTPEGKSKRSLGRSLARIRKARQSKGVCCWTGPDTGAAGCGTRNLVTQGGTFTVSDPERSRPSGRARGMDRDSQTPNQQGCLGAARPTAGPLLEFRWPGLAPGEPPRIRLDKQTSLTAHTRHALTHAKV